MVNSASLGEVKTAFKNWLKEQVIIHDWTINPPQKQKDPLLTVEQWLSCSAIDLPTEDLSFSRGERSLIGTAKFSFLLQYRIEKTALTDANVNEFGQLPLEDAENLLNNLCIRALSFPADIHPAISTIECPDLAPITISLNKDYTGGDPVLAIRPEFVVTFNAKEGVTPLQNTPDNGLITIDKIGLRLYKSEVGFKIENPDSYDLDRSLEILQQQQS